MARLGSLWRRFTDWLTAPRIAAILLVIGLLIVAIGAVYHHCECQFSYNFVAGWEQEFEGFYANFATTLIGIAIVVFTIDRANERRAERQRIEREQLAEQQAKQQLKEQLIREMGHPTDNGTALKAIDDLRARGWLTDGSLHREEFVRANLQEAPLSYANMRGAVLVAANLQKAVLEDVNLQAADLSLANLEEAKLNRAQLQGARLKGTRLRQAHLREANLQGVQDLDDVQLIRADSLRGAKMPNGRQYDGRFNLRFDLALAAVQTYTVTIEELPEAMARFYGVPLEVYLDGQKWADDNLQRERPRRAIAGGTSKRLSGLQHTVPRRTTTGSSSKRRSK